MAVVLVYPLRLASTAVGVVNFKGKRIIYKRDFYFLKSLVAYTYRVTNFIMCIDHICIECIGVKIYVCACSYMLYMNLEHIHIVGQTKVQIQLCLEKEISIYFFVKSLK